MAIINAIAIGKAKGSMGNMTLRYVKGATIGSQKVLKKGKGGTFKQVRVRARWGNLVNLFQAFDGTLLRAFETKNPRVSDFNAFMARNIGRSNVYLTASEVLQGGAVVFGMQISEGSLPSIAHSQGTGDVIVSNIAVGSLAISSSTTVKALSQAIINNNAGWQDGDQLSVFVANQTVNSETQVPYVEVRKIELTLDTSNESGEENIVRDFMGQDVLSVVDGFIGMGATVNGAACYVHSREMADGTLQVSSQSMFATNSLLANYQSAAQMLEAVDSYHVSKDIPFLTPNPGNEPAAPVTP